MQTIENRSEVDAREGKPRAVRISLCIMHDYLTLSGECFCAIKHIKYKFAVIGTDYGWLHNTAGDIKIWNSASGARVAAKRYVGL